MDGFKKNEEELKKYVEEYKIKLRKSVSGTVSISEYYRYRVPVSNIEGLLLNYVPILFFFKFVLFYTKNYYVKKVLI